MLKNSTTIRQSKATGFFRKGAYQLRQFYKQFSFYKWLLTVIDGSIIIAGYFIAAILHPAIWELYFHGATLSLVGMSGLYVFNVFLCLVLFQRSGLYRYDVITCPKEQLVKLSKSFLGWMVGFALLHFIIFPDIDKWALSIFFSEYLAFTAGGLFLFRMVIVGPIFKSRILTEINYGNHLIICRQVDHGTKQFVEQTLGRNSQVIYEFQDRAQSNETHAEKIYDSPPNNAGTSKYSQLSLDSVYITESCLTPETLTPYLYLRLNENNNIQWYLVRRVKRSGSSYEIIPLTTFFNLKVFLRFKRCIDFCIAILLLVILFPLMTLIGLSILLTSPGSPIFRQQRIGKNGRPFTFYKFRSMYIGSDADEDRKNQMVDFIQSQSAGNGDDTKIVNSSLITPIGRLLRKYSLDELPQLVNVFKGEMSLIGPRPALPYEYESYKNWHKSRTMVQPGCTGPWQVNGRSKSTFEEMVAQDVRYVIEMSPYIDLKILCKTIPVMIFGKGGG